ncbi:TRANSMEMBRANE PROTEIN [Salix viminalis]|uniref:TRANSMEMBRANE PROTEIN n=1 Tax=Salix viminalis TaxID=40686 RepID=A0A9Q0YZ58_SALVM|nr:TRANSMEMBRANE PROTEIN [Salix viminalis]
MSFWMVRARFILLNILDIKNLLVIAILLNCLGIAATLSRLQDRVQIFLAVLFWMSLFFWASVWDGKNNGKGRLNKGSRPKR